VAPRLSMSTRKAQKCCSQPPSQYNLPQLRPLAPKLPGHPVSPVQHRPQLEHQNIRNEQDTEALTTHKADFGLQHPATSQPYIPSVPSSHDFTLPSLLSPNTTFTNLERKQPVVVNPCTNIYSDRFLLTSAYGGFQGLAQGNLASGVDTHGSVDLSTQHLLYGDLQLQETTQNPQGQNFWMPTLHAPEDSVWVAMAQPTIGVDQGQSVFYPFNKTSGKMKMDAY